MCHLRLHKRRPPKIPCLYKKALPFFAVLQSYPMSVMKRLQLKPRPRFHAHISKSKYPVERLEKWKSCLRFFLFSFGFPWNPRKKRKKSSSEIKKHESASRQLITHTGWKPQCGLQLRPWMTTRRVFRKWGKQALILTWLCRSIPAIQARSSIARGSRAYLQHY